MKTDRIERRLKTGKKRKKIFKRINIKFSSAKKKNPKCLKLKKEITFKLLEVLENIHKRKITNADCSFANNWKSEIRKNGNL